MSIPNALGCGLLHRTGIVPDPGKRVLQGHPHRNYGVAVPDADFLPAGSAAGNGHLGHQALRSDVFLCWPVPGSGSLRAMPGYLIMLCGRIAAVGMLLIGMWSFMRTKDKFILYI